MPRIQLALNVDDDARADVAVLGLGAMGTALAHSLLAAGSRAVVWNRTPGRAEDLDGAILAAPAEVGAADTVILFSGPQEAYDAHRQSFETVAGRATYLGADPGLSSLHDVAVLALMWSVLNGFCMGPRC